MEENYLDIKPTKVLNLWYKNDDGYYLLTISEGLVKLNVTAILIWTLIDGKRTIRDIVGALAEKFKNVATEQLCADVIRTIKMFVDYEILTITWKSYKEA